jgi:protease-4
MLSRLLGALFRLLFLPLALFRRARAVPAGTYVAVEIDGRVTDVIAARRFWEIWRARSHATSLYALGKLVDTIAADDNVRGLLVTLKAIRGGMATATSLRAVLARARAAGREVVVHMPLGADTKELYVASVADRVYAGPQALLAPLGFASPTRYLRSALDRAGIEPDVLAVGRYKSAGEQLVRDEMSEAQREQLGALLDVFYTQVVAAFAEGRNITRERAQLLIDGAPYRAADAVAAGLIDGAAYEDEIPALLAQKPAAGAAPSASGPTASSEAPPRARIVEAARYGQLVRATQVFRPRRRGIVGVIQVHGAIAGETAGYGQSLATDERVIAAVRQARSDARVRGVILHVDSPGGSALASDRMHHELVQLAAEKPLVCCMANVAASGGYYVAAAAHAIVAQPTTITGSIGVVSARIVVEPLLERLGVHTEILKRGARADLLEPTRRLERDEREAMQRELEGVYQAFVRIVADGRKRPLDEIERLAQGRVWAGADAAKHGLVDALGGFDEALARTRALIGGDAPESLEPAILRGGRKPPPPLDPPRKAAAELLRGLASLAADAGLDAPLDFAPLAFGRDPVLAWSALASRFRV